MNKRQKKKRLEREKKEMLRSINFLENAYTQAAKEMRLEYHQMPQGEEKTYQDFFITGFEYAIKVFDLAKNQIRSIE
ncbi:hypothetical protein ACVRZG_02760 [Streptococcus hyovaginalis]|uniref:hypothetical protein n=1 Tax=Streptococcus hyovaginalis TaxID=149015 RepID=UPI0003FEA6C2|nr:hypothetical protein [Streptococcus hyovaginalis]QBX25439.1 hypothetical protein Javan258_0032 [Streptococcus phage Javan258]